MADKKITQLSPATQPLSGNEIIPIVQGIQNRKLSLYDLSINFPGAMGPMGPTGATGSQGSMGPQGPQGVQGNLGPQGLVGNTGAVGPTGPDGVVGNMGPTGPQGVIGVVGPTGATGEQGPTGAIGQGFKISKIYTTKAALEGDTSPSGITPGEFAVVATIDPGDLDNGRLYLWDGVAYSYITDMSGPQGIQGPQGVQGVQGIQGVQGNVGPTGATGLTGSIGPTGTAGAMGPTGSMGLTGALGPTGSQGPIGPQGIQGVQGNVGPTGAQSPKSIYIPTPKVFCCFNNIDEKAVSVKWNSGDKEFLNHQPKYFLFRYRGQGKHSGAPGPSRRRGFTHPVHLNGAGATRNGWWSGAAFDSSETIMPAKITEWTVPVAEGEALDLNLNVNDWSYSATGVMPTAKSNLRVHGAHHGRLNVYFYIAIGIQLTDDSIGCPYTFGNPSVIFSLRPIRSNPLVPYGEFDRWVWRIEG